ncbi:MAG: hotdog fold thioesterase [Betaproteobacteria bacterium]|nr:hotdog fold thioesterase [Betaproteobacteria bacterium]
MAIWHGSISLEGASRNSKGTMMEACGIEILERGEDWLKGRMPVDSRTRQVYGILHGGASCVLAETLGSMASAMVVDAAKFRVAGIEINANHVRSVSEGWVEGIARPLHLGRTTHIWDIRITNVEGKLVCVSRLTTAILAAG